MLDRHDLARAVRADRPRGHIKIRSERSRVDGQTMVSRRCDWAGQSGEQTLSVMPDVIGLTVHDLFGGTDGRASGLGNRLVSKTNA